jgi:5'-AMP-activated protein kinase catalytic alpha subunit
MIAGKKYEGLNVDVWSCGVILFAMVCGYLPFEDPNTSALYKKILAGDYTIPKFVSADAKDLLKGVLNTDPEKRLTLKDIKNHRWMAQARLPTQCDGLIVGYHRIPTDMDILEQLKEFSFDVENSKRFL